MEMIAMSKRERRRMAVMTRVADGLLPLRAAAEMLRVSYRQAKRIWRRYRKGGDVGLVHLGRGQRSNRARPAVERARAVALYRKRYADFGPLLASEHLADDHGIVVSRETLRRWLMAQGLWEVRQRREAHRAARERRPRRGDLVQIDGSEHDWFEGRGPRAVLMVMIDDATNTTLARFYPTEDTAAAYDIFERYVQAYGLPFALYPDRDSIYICTREAHLDEELADRGPETQFARAMRELGVDLIPAHSPQAKGRVERRHGLFQDRLVKEMRLLDIDTIRAGNTFLDDRFLKLVNTRYTVAARDSANGHLPRPAAARLDLVLSWQEPRSIAKDWTLSWRNHRFQIDARHAALSLPGRRVTVVQRRDDTLVILYGQRPLTFRDAPARTIPTPAPPPVARRPTPLPASNHPWRIRAIAPRPAFPPPSDELCMAHSREAGNRAAAALTRSAANT